MTSYSVFLILQMTSLFDFFSFLWFHAAQDNKNKVGYTLQGFLTNLQSYALSYFKDIIGADSLKTQRV